MSETFLKKTLLSPDSESRGDYPDKTTFVDMANVRLLISGLCYV